MNMTPDSARERAPVFIVMPFDKAFDDIYEVIKQVLTEMDLGAIRADEIPVGRRSIDNIYNAIEQAGLVIGVTSESNPNVFYELGYADHLGKETILLTDAPEQLPVDLRDRNHLVYKTGDLSKLAAELKLWLTESRFLSSETPRGAILTRGQVFDTVVDGAFYLQPTKPVPSKEEILSYLTQKTAMPQRLLYLTEEGQTTYLKLCADREYAYYWETYDYVADNGAELVETILKHCESTEVDFISLGPGNGQKDAVFLTEFLRRAQLPRYTYYYPYDVSGGLLLEALRTIRAKELPLEKLRVKAIEADVQHLGEFKKVFDFREEPNIYSLLGGLDDTANETALLTSLHKLMTSRDCLLLEVRKKVGAGPQALGNEDLNRRLDLAALRSVGAEVNPQTVRYESVISTSSVPGTSTVAAVVEKMKLDGVPYEDVRLFNVHYYDTAAIVQRVTDVGFQLLHASEQPNSLFYICARA
jgi:Histidine-specific methyltransferase, SAM-dependent